MHGAQPSIDWETIHFRLHNYPTLGVIWFTRYVVIRLINGVVTITNPFSGPGMLTINLSVFDHLYPYQLPDVCYTPITHNKTLVEYGFDPVYGPVAVDASGTGFSHFSQLLDNPKHRGAGRVFIHPEGAFIINTNGHTHTLSWKENRVYKLKGEDFV